MESLICWIFHFLKCFVIQVEFKWVFWQYFILILCQFLIIYWLEFLDYLKELRHLEYLICSFGLIFKVVNLFPFSSYLFIRYNSHQLWVSSLSIWRFLNLIALDIEILRKYLDLSTCLMDLFDESYVICSDFLIFSFFNLQSQIFGLDNFKLFLELAHHLLEGIVFYC